MSSRQLKLFTTSGDILASLSVQWAESRYLGQILHEQFPPAIKDIFQQYEQAVENQLFTLEDELQGKILALGLQVGFDQSTSTTVDELQVYPSHGTISFSVANKLLLTGC